MWDFVSDFTGALLTTLTGVFFCKLVFGKKIVSRRLIVSFSIFIVSIIISFPFLLNYLYLRTIMSCFLYMSLYKYTFKLNLSKSLLCSIIYVIVVTISEIIVFLLLTKVINVDINFIYGVFAGSIFSNVIICVISLMISLINKRWLIKILNMKIKNLLVLYIVLLFLCVIFFFYVTFSNIGNGISLLSGVTTIIVILIVLISLIVQSYKNNELMIKYDKLLEFIKKYEIEIDNQRTMRHEIKNQLLTIKSKIIDKDNNKNIIDYIDQILEDNNRGINHTLYAKLNCLPPNGIKGLFYFKVSEALENGIDIDINISKEIRDSVLVDLNSIMFNQVGKLFGILLDNAIEASKVTEKKKMGIEIYVVDDKVNFIVSNTYIGKINPSIGMFSRSSKGDKRGHGLLLAKFLVNNNDRFSLDTMITDDLYIQKLVIK